MISLRQHAISLVAVFAALIIGLFLGTGFLGDKVNSLTGTSRDRVGDLNDQLDEANAARNVRTASPTRWPRGAAETN